MIDNKPVITEPVRRLMEMEDELVFAKDLAPILKMSPDVIIHHAKNGEWQFCRFIISGNRVKFFRRDFLQKCGFMEKEPEGQTDDKKILEQLIGINEGVTMICQMLTLMMEPYQLDALNELIRKKEAEA